LLEAGLQLWEARLHSHFTPRRESPADQSLSRALKRLEGDENMPKIQAYAAQAARGRI